MSGINNNLLSKKLGISPKACERLVGSVRVIVEEKEYELGLRAERRYLDAEFKSSFTDEQIEKVCKDYAAACPAVYKWLCSGDFNGQFEDASKRQPITAATIIHACRTAGRLRAELIQVSF